MPNITTPLTGVVHGNAIELQRPLGLPEGQIVSIVVTLPADPELSPEEGIRLSAGGWANDDEEGLDEFLEWRRQQRKHQRPAIEP